MEHEITKEELDKALLEVRKSYRIIYKFQRNVMDLLKFINDYLGWTLVGSRQEFSNNTRKMRPDFQNWAWDWIPMYQYNFMCSDNNNKVLNIGIRLISDTGYHEANYDRDPTNLNTFKPDHESSTLLTFYLCGVPWKNEIGEAFNNSTNAAFKAENKHHVVTKENSYAFVHYSLSCFYSEDETKKILDNLIELCCNNGIKIQAKQEKF